MATLSIPSNIQGCEYYAIVQIQSAGEKDVYDVGGAYYYKIFRTAFLGGKKDAIIKYLNKTFGYRPQYNEKEHSTSYYGFLWKGDPNKGDPESMIWDDIADKFASVPYSTVKGVSEYYGEDAVKAFINLVYDIKAYGNIEWNDRGSTGGDDIVFSRNVDTNP